MATKSTTKSTTKSAKNAWKKATKAVKTGKKLKSTVGEKMRGFGLQYKCIWCRNWIPNRQAKTHDAACGAAARALINDQKKQKQQQEQTAEAPVPVPVPAPEPPKPKTTKQRARPSSNGSTNTDGGTMPDQNGGEPRVRPARPVAAPAPGQNGGPPPGGGGGGGGGSSRPPVSSEAHAVLVAFQAWKEADVRTVSDLKAHLMSMEVVFIEIANGLQQYAMEKIIGRRLHPMIAAPLQLAADAVAGIGHHFTQSYINFERIYAGRLEYERSNIPKPDPKDPIFEQVD